MRVRGAIGPILVAACAAGYCAPRPGEDPEKKALEKRVAQLEAQLAASTPTPTSPIEARPSPMPKASLRGARPVASPTQSVRAQPESPLRTPAQPLAPLPDDDLPPVALDDPLPSEPPAEPDRSAVIAERWSIPDGAELELVLETALSTRTNAVGDPVVARIAAISDADGPLPLPGGSVVEGRLARVRSAGRVGRTALLCVLFDHITVRGRRQSLEPIAITLEGPSDVRRDGSLVTGGAVAGAIIGGILGGRGGARRGAAIGGVGGAGAAAATKAKELELEPGERWTVTAARAARVLRE